MAAVFAATQNAVVLSSYAPYITQTAVEAHALRFAQQAGPILRLHTKPSSEGGFHCVVNFVDAAAAEAAVVQLRPPPVGGKVPTVQCWTGKLQAYLSSELRNLSGALWAVSSHYVQCAIELTYAASARAAYANGLQFQLL